MTFSETIKKLREDANISQENMGKTLGVDQKTVSNWEYGITEPSVSQLKKIAKFFDVSYEALLDYE